MPPPARIGSQIKTFPITLDLGATRSLRILRIRETQENASDIPENNMDKKNQSRRAFLRTSIASGASLAAVGLHAAPVGIYQPGTYSAKASGIGDVVVTMTFDSNKMLGLFMDRLKTASDTLEAAADQVFGLRVGE